MRWPSRIPAGSVYKEMVCLNDWFATVAAILEKPLPVNAAEDSVSLLPALLAKTAAPLRKTLVHHSANGTFAIRQGQWKLILAPDSGGWSDPKPNTAAAKGLPPVQLYHMQDDNAELRNQHTEQPEVVTRLTRLLLQEIANGSTSTPASF
ncbi:MAG: hypothetical protein EBS01_14215 [Verrucomicrobia bacterium]|nr:hypothetical protein [Verrucomicrobiota bacterium]